MSRPITKADAARKRGVTGAAITKWCGKHPDAVLPGGRIDASHPAWREYVGATDDDPTDEPMADESAQPDPPVPRPKAPRPERTSAPRSTPERGPSPLAIDADGPDGTDFDSYKDLTLDELCRRHGTVQGVSDWLDARKRIGEIHERDLKNAEREGQLIPRALVSAHVFSAIENANRRLLMEAAKTIAHELYPMARRGEPVELAERKVRELMGKVLSPVAITAARVLREKK